MSSKANFEIENNVLKSCSVEHNTDIIEGVYDSTCEITVPDGVKVIAKNAFFIQSLFIAGGENENNVITKINLPDTVVEIQEGAFKYCSSLESITLPRNLKKIDASAFEGCISLESIDIDENNPYYSCVYGSLYNKDHSVLIKVPARSSDFKISNRVTKIGSYAFDSCKFNTNITLPNNIKTIGARAFANSKGFPRVKISNNVEVLDEGVFYNCDDLQKVVMPENLKEIKDSAFSGCDSLRHVSIPDTLEVLGRSVFAYCHSISHINIPGGVKQIKENTFLKCDGLERVEFENGVNSINAKAFDKCENLKDIYISSTVKEIDSEAFSEIKNLESIEISLENPNYYAKDCRIYDKRTNKCILCSENKVNTVEADKSMLTSSVKVLPKGTDGSIGPNGRYVLFGDWPQSLKKDDVTIDTTTKYLVNDFECYKGSDNAYYVRQTTDDGKAISMALFGEAATFDNKEKIVMGESYYFKMESIKWRILSADYQGGKLLALENLLEPYAFFSGDSDDEMEVDGKIIYPNNYEYSDIRKYLNSDFISKAFTKEASEKLRTVVVSNNEESTTDNANNIEKALDYVCNDTKDKVFLLSENEVTNPSYGFAAYDVKRKESGRVRRTTDYARCVGIVSTINEIYDNTSGWWLRTPDDENSECCLYVGFGGGATANDYEVNSSEMGYVAAISLDF